VGVKYLTGAYSRDREVRADELGARLADAAGYGREGAVRLLERLDRLRNEGMADALGLGQYFASHPPTAARVKAVKNAPPV
jgi:Zn-dependent protease with chaperone function